MFGEYTVTIIMIENITFINSPVPHSQRKPKKSSERTYCMSAIFNTDDIITLNKKVIKLIYVFQLNKRGKNKNSSSICNNEHIVAISIFSRFWNPNTERL